MKEKNHRFLQILELSQDIIYMVEFEPELKMLYINPSVTKKLGISVADNYANPNMAFESTHPDDIEKFKIKTSGKLDYSEPIQVRYRNIDGEYIWFEESAIPIYDDEKKLIALVGFCRDIQERKLMEDKLKALSYNDCLTGIKNRTCFEDEVDELESRGNEQIGIIISDLDNLKYINDNFGHLQGDELLKQFAKIIDRYSEENIMVARIGGDEFVILIKGKSGEFIEDIKLDVLKSIEMHNLQNKGIPIKVSIGSYHSETSLGITREVYNIADSRMYENKANNKKHNNGVFNVGRIQKSKT